MRNTCGILPRLEACCVEPPEQRGERTVWRRQTVMTKRSPQSSSLRSSSTHVQDHSNSDQHIYTLLSNRSTVRRPHVLRVEASQSKQLGGTQNRLGAYRLRLAGRTRLEPFTELRGRFWIEEFELAMCSRNA